MAERLGIGELTLAYDHRGAGQSGEPEGPYSVEGYAEDLERLLDGCGLERAALVGHSVGSAPALSNR